MYVHMHAQDIFLYNIIFFFGMQLDFFVEVPLIFCQKVAPAPSSAVEFYNDAPVNFFRAFENFWKL